MAWHSRAKPSVSLRVVAAGPAPPEHRVLLVGLEPPPADEPGVLVGLEVAHPYDHRVRPAGGGDTGDAVGQPFDEVAGQVVVAPGELGDPAAVVLVGTLRVHQGHRVDLDVVVDDELHPGQADAVGGQPPPAEGRGGVGQVEHDPGPGRRDVVQADLLVLVVAQARVDEALVALRAGDGHRHAVAQTSGRVAGADDRGDAELPADDGGVRGAAAVVGDDRRGPFHDRLPVGVGDLRDEHRSVHEAVDLRRAAQVAHRPRRYRVSDGQPLHQRLGRWSTGVADAVRAQQRRLPAPMDGLRAGLDQEDLAGPAVLGPFHVHRGAVVVLHRDGPPGQQQDLLLVQRVPDRLVLGRLELAGSSHRVVDDLAFLAAADLRHDRAQAGVAEQRLEDHILVGIHPAADHRLAEPPGGVDQHRPGNPVSVSIENITPAAPRSERTMRCTPTDRATSR